MTAIPICDTGRRMGRKMLWPDKIVAPLPRGSLKRMESVLADGEDKTDLLREAVERELQRRGSMPEDEAPAPVHTPKTKPRAKPPSPSKD